MASKPSKKSYYMGNQNLPVKGTSFEYTAEMISEIEKCKTDLLHFAENYFFILNIDDGRKKIKLFEAQKRILRGIDSNRFFCLMASRQIGKSTLATIYILWLANFFPDQKILLVANKESTAMEIFDRVRMAYEMLPNWLKSGVDEYAKTSMKLENGSTVKITTTTGTAGRGSSCSLLIVDECAWIEPHLLQPFWASVFPIISSSKKAKIFMCSTPNGTGNLFHQIYTESLNAETPNGWGSDKILWNEVPGRDEKWKREIKSGLGSDEQWRVEFECEFINSGTSSMNEDLYESLKLKLRKPMEVLMNGKYNIYDIPQRERVYVAGVDTAEGIGSDSSVIKILDITDLDEIVEVAEFCDNMISVSEFANVVYEILGHWGNPIVCIERNNQGGQVADRLGIDYGYEKVVCWGGKLAGRKNQELLGMISSRNTKFRAVSNARYFYSDKGCVSFSNSFGLEEIFKDFVKQPNDTWAAITGKHDDRTMALIWALMILDKELCEEYFTIEEYDECGKPKRIVPFDHDLGEYRQFTSIYTNEHVERIEGSFLAPVAFGGRAGVVDEVSSLMDEGWEYLNGSPYYDPGQNISPNQWDTIDKYFG